MYYGVKPRATVGSVSPKTHTKALVKTREREDREEERSPAHKHHAETHTSLSKTQSWNITSYLESVQANLLA